MKVVYMCCLSGCIYVSVNNTADIHVTSRRSPKSQQNRGLKLNHNEQMTHLSG